MGLRKGTEERPPPETGVCDLCGADRDAGDLCCSARQMPRRHDMEGVPMDGPRSRGTIRGGSTSPTGEDDEPLLGLHSPRCRYTRLINPEEVVKAALAALVQEREVYCTQFRGADYFYCNY